MCGGTAAPNVTECGGTAAPNVTMCGGTAAHNVRGCVVELRHLICPRVKEEYIWNMGGVLIDRVNRSSIKSVSQRYFVLHIPYKDRLTSIPGVCSQSLWIIIRVVSRFGLWWRRFCCFGLFQQTTPFTHALTHPCTHTHTPSRAKEKEIEDFCPLGYDALLSGKERPFGSA